MFAAFRRLLDATEPRPPPMPTSRRRRALKDTPSVCRVRRRRGPGCQATATRSIMDLGRARTRSPLLLVQGRGLVDRLAAALPAPHQVLRVVLRGAHRAAARLGVAGE